MTRFCLDAWKKDDGEHILIELHDGLTGGHFSGETTAHKVLRAGYYWPTLFKDAHAHAHKCQIDLHSHFNPLLLRIPSNNGDWM